MTDVPADPRGLARSDTVAEPALDGPYPPTEEMLSEPVPQNEQERGAAQLRDGQSARPFTRVGE